MHEIPFLSLAQMHAPIKEELFECARKVIESGIYINGPETISFAKELSETLKVKNVVPVSNGLDAIRLILRSYIETGKLKPGDEVMAPANTYIASILPIAEMGLIPVLIKPDLDTYGIDWAEAENHISEKTRALITVHLYGTPSWDFTVANRLKDQGITIIEDNAQAIGASVEDPSTGMFSFTGSLGDSSAFSFYPTKNIGALGDAGALCSKNPVISTTAKALANYGSTVRYLNELIGYNCRMDELQAAFLRLKLKYLGKITESRQHNASIYNEAINNPAVIKPKFLSGMHQVWHQYVIRTPRRDKLRNYLADHGVATDIHYPLSLFEQKCFHKANPKLMAVGEAEKVAEQLASEVLSLPIATVTDDEILTIAQLINDFKN